jgi:hypothetical protein
LASDGDCDSRAILISGRYPLSALAYITRRRYRFPLLVS